MTKVSTNAGKHPYLRTGDEYDHLFDHLWIKTGGIKMNHAIQPKFKTVIDTGKKDKRGKKLFFKDVVLYEKKEYQIDYNAKDFYWILRLNSDPTKTHPLNSVCKSCNKK